MSNKELAIQLLNDIPEYKLGYAIAYLQGLRADEEADDAYCELLLEEYKNSSDKDDFVPLDEALEICGVSLDELQD